MVNIKTAGYLIRNLKPEDAEALHEVLSDAEVMKYIEAPFTLEETAAFIKAAGMGEPPLVYALVDAEADKVIGHVIFHAYDDEDYEIGWIIRKDYWGRGIACGVTEALIMYAQREKIKGLIIEFDTGQTTSRHIAEKCGFVFEREEAGRQIYRLEVGII